MNKDSPEQVEFGAAVPPHLLPVLKALIPTSTERQAALYFVTAGLQAYHAGLPNDVTIRQHAVTAAYVATHLALREATDPNTAMAELRRQWIDIGDKFFNAPRVLEVSPGLTIEEV